MANVTTTGYFTDFELQRQQLERQQAIADALRKEAMEPIQTNQMAGGYVVPVNPLQHIAKLAQVLAGNYKQSKLDEQGKEIARQQNEYLGKQADDLSYAMTPRKGMPTQEFTTGDPTGMGPVGTAPATPDYNPGQAEMNQALTKYLTNIGQPTKAADYVIQDAKQRMFTNMLTGGSTASEATAPAQSDAPAAPGMFGQPAPTSPQGATPTPAARPVSAYQLLSPEDKNIVQGFIMAGKQDKAMEHMADVLKVKLSADGKAFISRNGRISAMPGSIDAFNSFQQAANANTLAPTDVIKNADGTLTPRTIAQVISDTQSASPPSGVPPITPPSTSRQMKVTPAQQKAQETDRMKIWQDELAEEIAKPVDTRPGAYYTQAVKDQNVAGLNSEISKMSGKPSAPKTVGQSTLDKQFQEQLGSGMAKTLVEGQTKSEEMRDQVLALDKSMDLIKSGAILGAGADLKVDAAKILNSTFNTNISPDKVANTDFLRSTLGMPILTKAKALGYNPTDADAKRLDVILGTISKDPMALPKLLEFNREMAIKGIEAHNSKAANVKGPYSLTVQVPGPYVFNPQSAPSALPNAGSRVRTYNPATGKVE